MIKFDVKDKDLKARAGIIATARGNIETPFFAPVTGALGVDGIFPVDLHASGIEALFTDTYHLMMRYGNDFASFAEPENLPQTLGWEGSLLTDSGSAGIDRDDVSFKSKEEGLFIASYIDGARHKITPENSIAAQAKLKADIMTSLYDRADVKRNRKKIGMLLRRTARWARRAVAAASSYPDKGVLAVITGGSFADLRTSSVKLTVPLNPDGFLQDAPFKGEDRAAWLNAVAYSTSLLPENKVCAVRGVETPSELIKCVAAGIDIIISDAPFVKATQGIAFTSAGEIDLKEKKYFADAAPLDGYCSCGTCKKYTRSYLHHLFTAEEILGTMLLVAHNIHFFNSLATEVRNAVKSQRFEEFMRTKGVL